jgi:hypothetical protein
MGLGAPQAGPPLQVVDGDARPDAALRLKQFREQHPDVEINWRHPWEAAIPEPDGYTRFVMRYELHDLLDEAERRLAEQPRITGEGGRADGVH